jgi:soluble P-type ATPase
VIEVDVPGWKPLRLEHLVLDFNGTLGAAGRVAPGVRERLVALSRRVEVHVVTADTFGRAREELAGLPLRLTVLPPGAQSEAKRDYVNALGAGATAAVGNGRNDRLMLETAALGIAVSQGEGTATQALLAADLCCGGIAEALDLLADPLRLVAALRG